MTAENAPLEALAELFSAGPAALLTGAGLSTDSGIPDYRGAGTPPRTPMSIDQFSNDDAYRRRFWAGARVGAQGLANVQPNAGHRAVATLERDGRLSGVITQNVDGLDRLAGVRNVVELHGRLDRVVCLTCARRFSRQ